MASPTKPLVIAATADNATEGHNITVQNLTAGGKIVKEMNASGQIVIDAGNLSTWATNDVIIIYRSGSHTGGQRLVVGSNKNPAKQVLTTTAITTPSISL